MSDPKPTQANMVQLGMALLHRLIKAGVGQASIYLKDAAEDFSFGFNIVDGRAVFLAVDKPPAPAIVPAPASALDRLRPVGPAVPINGKRMG